MIEQIYTYFAVEMIYLWLNIGVLSFWFMLLFFPQAKICKIFVTSIFPILILAAIDLYLIIETYKTGFNLLDGFKLYLGIDELLNLFSDTNFITGWVILAFLTFELTIYFSNTNLSIIFPMAPQIIINKPQYSR